MYSHGHHYLSFFGERSSVDGFTLFSSGTQTLLHSLTVLNIGFVHKYVESEKASFLIHEVKQFEGIPLFTTRQVLLMASLLIYFFKLLLKHNTFEKHTFT